MVELLDYAALVEENQKQLHLTCGSRSVVLIRNTWCSGGIQFILFCENCKLEIDLDYAKYTVREVA